MFFPLAMFLRGKKFTTGIKIRNNMNNSTLFKTGKVKKNYLRRPALMTKLVARYAFCCLFPARLGFFDDHGQWLKERPESYNKFHSYNKEFWACFTLCLTLLIIGLMISPVGILWFFIFATLHSQFNLTGQFFAQRYMYLALVGLCVVVGTMIQPYPIVVAVVTTILVVRTHFFIPAWRNIESLWRNDIDAFPHSALVYNNLAQYLVQVDAKRAPVWRTNEIGYLLFKAESMDQSAWEIQMNLGCFFAQLGHTQEVLNRTNRAIALLEPLGGLPTPLNVLKKQRGEVEKILADNNAEHERTLNERVLTEQAVPV